MYKKEIERKFLVDKTKLPNIHEYESFNIIQGYLNKEYDSLEVRIRYQGTGDPLTNAYYLIMKDEGTKIRNEITYNITKSEFDISIQLCGHKIIKKTRYLIPNSFDETRIMELDVYDDEDFVICKYEAETEILVDSLHLEDWFLEEVTNDPQYKNGNIALSKLNIF